MERVQIIEGYRPGLIGQVTYLHASFYSENYGFGAVFERKVASELAEFMGRIDQPENTTLSAYDGSDLLGTVSIDGTDLEQGEGHLRWLIVSPVAHGMGLGNRLMHKAVAFCEAQGFDRTRLWTFKGLDAARHLYEKHGFHLAAENPGNQWGTEVIEQEFSRHKPA